MTKTKLGTSETKPTEGSPAPLYTAVHVTDYEQPTQQQVSLPGTTCWYVFGILSTIFCCLPCGVIGLVHAMVAKHEGERGNVMAHRQRLRQAKCWTCWSILLGLLVVILMTLYVIGSTVGFSRAYGWVCGNDYGWYGNDYLTYNDTQMNDTMYDQYDEPRLIIN